MPRSFDRIGALARMCAAAPLVCALALALAEAARAEDPNGESQAVLKIEPAVVTVRRWPESPSSVPQRLSILDEEQLRDAGVRSVRDASMYVPNLYLTEFSSRRLSFPAFRGVNTGVGDPSVTTYIDGVPQLSVSSSNLSWLDVRRIEFLPGPQGTLYGRNSIGGLIRIETGSPSDALRGRVESTVGSFALQEYSVVASVPIAEGWGLGLAGQYSRRDGFAKSRTTKRAVDGRESTLVRAKVRFDPNPRNALELVLYGERARDGGFVLESLEALRARPHRITADFAGGVERDLGSIALTWVHSAASFELTSVSALGAWEVAEDSDFDFSGLDLLRRFTAESQASFFQEVRVGSPADAAVGLSERGTLRWLLGGAAFYARGDDAAKNVFRGDASWPLRAGDFLSSGADRSALGLAIFGQGSLKLFDALELTGGLRYDHEEKDADIFGESSVLGRTSGRRRSEAGSFDEVLPVISVAWIPSDDGMLYGRCRARLQGGRVQHDRARRQRALQHRDQLELRARRERSLARWAQRERGPVLCGLARFAVVTVRAGIGWIRRQRRIGYQPGLRARARSATGRGARALR